MGVEAGRGKKENGGQCYPVVQEKDRANRLLFPLATMQNKILADNDSAREHAMSQPAVAALAPLPFELVLDDGEPLETEWHTLEYPLLRKLIRQAMAEQGRTDFYTGGNMFVYYSLEQAWEVAQEVAQGLEPPEQKAFRGPDDF